MQTTAFTHTKEFHELREYFERTAKTIFWLRPSFVREQNAPSGYFYADGPTNIAFHAFIAGNSYGKCVARMEHSEA